MDEYVKISSTARATPIIHADSISLMCVIGIVALGCMFKSGYELGQRVADKMIKRHDKDVAKLEKKTRRYLRSEKKLIKKRGL
ncbi:MAG: hypothetical protein J6Q84_07245 [Kiritimatiellae bacterium]|nr:hypothetical protein [Kiritimatiellia bacterium]